MCKRYKKKRKYFIRGIDISVLAYAGFSRKIGRIQYNKAIDAFQFYTSKNLDEILCIIQCITSDSIEIVAIGTNDINFPVVNMIVVGKRKEVRQKIIESLKRDKQFNSGTLNSLEKKYYSGKINAWEYILELLKEEII